MSLPILNKFNFAKISWHKIIDKLIPHLKMIATIMILIIFLPLAYFLYNDFYLTVISAKKIDQINNESVGPGINTELLEKLEAKHKQKTNIPLKNWDGFNEIFTAQKINARPSNNADLEDERDNDLGPTENITPLISF